METEEEEEEEGYKKKTSEAEKHDTKRSQEGLRERICHE
jgi:hypothetical protein